MAVGTDELLTEALIFTAPQIGAIQVLAKIHAGLGWVNRIPYYRLPWRPRITCMPSTGSRMGVASDLLEPLRTVILRTRTF
jgi:hypothetical protein